VCEGRVGGFVNLFVVFIKSIWKKSVGKWEEKMFLKIQDAVTLLNQEYVQSFCISKGSRAQDL